MEPQSRLNKIAAVLVSCAALCLLVWAAAGQILSLAAPFAAAYLAAALLKPLAAWVARKAKISRKAAGGVLALLVFFSAVTLLVSVSGRLWGEVSGFLAALGSLGGDVGRFLSELRDKLPFPDDFFTSPTYETVIAALQNAAASFGGRLTAFLTSLCAALPGSVFSVFVFAASFFYLMADAPGIAASVRSLLPEKYAEGVRRLVVRGSGALFGYLRAVLLLTAVTFLELWLGLSLLGVRYAFVVALLLALVDALPVLGAGCVLVPWAAAALLRQEFFLGAGLLILLAVMMTVRQLLEPHLVGRFIGVHPFLALAAVFCGYRLGGFVGMIAAPVILTTVKEVAENGKEAAGRERL